MKSIANHNMNTALQVCAAMLLCLAPVLVGAAARYVNVNSTNATPPYTNWATAATVIQDAIDVASDGDEIVVTNGIYQAGGRVVHGALMNRVAVTKPLTVRSVNGPEVTMIRGDQVPGTTNGDGAVRCLYLTNGATLVGFTLTNGATRTWPVSSGYDLTGGGVLCESTSATISNCVVTGNAASQGGGAYRGTLNNCTFTGNSASYGGGTCEGVLNNCTLTGNSAGDGGGASYSTLNGCALTGNLAYGTGGGAAFCTLNNCALNGNSAASGGGASGSALNNCTVTGNSARHGGGVAGYQFCSIEGCEPPIPTILRNCIIYYNTAENSGANYPEFHSVESQLGLGYEPELVFINHSCTTPLPASGVGNITGEPQLASLSHIAASSPCRGAGSAEFAAGLDVDGQPWMNPPSMGCDEVHPGTDSGPLTTTLKESFTTVAAGFEVNITAQILGYAMANGWEFDDGTVFSNRVTVSHAWQAAGDYTVVVRAYNQANPGGISATVTVHVVEAVHYVAADSSNPVAPFTSWATAATSIQDAVDAASVAGAVVLVTNGVYQTGGYAVHGTMTNRVAVTKPLRVRSVNGPEATIIHGHQVPGTTNGDGAVRCVYLTNGAALVGFTLTNGATRGVDDWGDWRERSGGGVWCESPTVVVSHCWLTGNSASGIGGGACGGTLNNCALARNSAGAGGGASASSFFEKGISCTLNNCLLEGNRAFSGGGALRSTLNNCTVAGNSALWGGGAYDGTLNNCIVYFNTATNGANYYDQDWFGSGLSYCVTTPLPSNGVGNITNAPLFIDPAASNLRLQSNSPCINAGLNAYAPGYSDLDGHVRIVSGGPIGPYAGTPYAGGTVDIGAYEFQAPQSAISYVWLQEYGLRIDGSTDNADTDGDGRNNFQEWAAWTDPTNSRSVLKLLGPLTSTTGMVLRWHSVSGQSYFLERSTQLGAQAIFQRIAANIIGQTGTTTFIDTDAAGTGPFFYRIGVEANYFQDPCPSILYGEACGGIGG